MPRAIWSGSITFGMVNVPVQLFSATEQKDVAFHQFDSKSGKRIHNKRVAEGSGREVDYDDIVKGYEVSGGKYVLITPEELEAVEPGRSRTIDVEDFVDLAEIDPVYFEKTYYLAPEAGRGAEKAYALLHKAMADAGKIAVARFVMRTKQYLAAIRPSGRLLVLDTMYFPDEVRPTKDLEDRVKGVRVSDKELRMATQLIASLESPWEPSRYRDTYRERVLDLIERKRKGKDVVVDEETEHEDARVVDLMAALEASVEAARARRAGSGRAKRASSSSAGSKSATRPAGTKRAPARKTASAKAKKAGTRSKAASRKAS